MYNAENTVHSLFFKVSKLLLWAKRRRRRARAWWKALRIKLNIIVVGLGIELNFLKRRPVQHNTLSSQCYTKSVKSISSLKPPTPCRGPRPGAEITSSTRFHSKRGVKWGWKKERKLVPTVLKLIMFQTILPLLYLVCFAPSYVIINTTLQSYPWPHY